MRPAARLGDTHICPMVVPATPPIPHVGGPATSGAPNVLIGGQPAARAGDSTICTAVGIPDPIVTGSATVFICGMPAARMGDSTAHGGIIVAGCVTVLIGDSASTGGVGGSGASSNTSGKTRSGKNGQPAKPVRGGAEVVAAIASGAAITAPALQAKALKLASKGGTAVCEPCNAAASQRKRRNRRTPA